MRYNSTLFSTNKNIEKEMSSLQTFISLFEQTKYSNTYAELNALMQLFEASFSVYEEHLVIELFSHCENLCIHLNAEEQLTRLYFLLGMTYFKQNEYKIASTHFIHSAVHSNTPQNNCVVYCYIAHCYLQIKNYEQALNYTKTAFWLRNKHQITDALISHHIYYQFCLIYKELKLPYVNYYMHFLDEFFEIPGYERDKGKIYLLKASIEAENKNYNKEYEHLKFALNCYLKTYNLNRQIIVLNFILNCPSSSKTTSEQNEYIRKLNEISNTFKSVYTGFSFKKQLLQFEITKKKQPILTFDLQEIEFQKICEESLSAQPFLLIVSLKDHSKFTIPQILSKYKEIENLLFSKINYDAIVSTFQENQLIFLIQKEAIKDSLTFFENVNQHIQKQIVASSVGFAQADHDTLSFNKLYNHAYVNFYYNHTN